MAAPLPRQAAAAAGPTPLPEILGVVFILGYELDGMVQRELPPTGTEAEVVTAGPDGWSRSWS